MISAERLLSLLEERDLLPPGVLAKLRQQVAQAEGAVGGERGENADREGILDLGDGKAPAA